MSGALGRSLVLVLCGVLAACGGDRTAADHFREGEELVMKGEFDQAIAAYQKGLELEPGSAVGHNLLGMAYRFKYNAVRTAEWKEKELAEFEKAVASDSTFWPAYVNLGATLFYMGKKAEATPHFRRALDLYPDNPEREELEKLISQGTGDPEEVSPDSN